MRYYVLIILAYLLLILPVTGFTAPHIQTVVQCSNDPISTIAGNGAVDIQSTPPGAWYTINGNPMGLTPGGQFLYKGTWTVTVGFPHSSTYNDYSTSVVVCDQKLTYVKVTFVPITTTVPTTAAPVRAGMTFAQPTTTIVTGITTAVPTTTVTIEPGITTQVTQQATDPVVAGSATPPDTLGSLSVTTTPTGAFIFIDGVQRGVSPATIPGLSAGTHTVLLKLDGYQDLSTPVTIAAGKVQDYTTAMAKNTGTAETPAGSANATNATKKGIAPGFEFGLALSAIAAIMVMRRQS